MRMPNKLYSSLSTLAIALVSFFAITSCSDEEDSFIPTLPATGGENVKSITRNGGITNTAYDWDFSYRGPRLTSASGVIRDPDNTIDKSHHYKSEIKYGDRRVEVVNSNNQEINILLNGTNHIEKMEVGKNIYVFHYDNGRLCAWQKTVFEDSFGQANQYKSSAVIEYENEDFKSITFVGPDNVKVTTSFTPDTRPNTNGLLPETIANEFGCLGFEHLYYAGLLGRPTAHLIKSLSVNHPENKEKCYTLTFDYSIKGNNTVLCNYKTPIGEPISVTYSY